LLGFLLEWPTLLTVLMLPVLLVMYARLARGEEHEMQERFGNEWDLYSENTPAFIPRLRRSSPEMSVTRRRMVISLVGRQSVVACRQPPS
jgi:hypothetical protein